MTKTTRGFNWTTGRYVRKTLTRSFDTLEQARRFAEGKEVVDIFTRKGRFVVEWVKMTIPND